MANEEPEVTAAAADPYRTVPVNVFTKATAYFVTMPDGTVVSCRGDFPMRQVGVYVIDGVQYIVRQDTTLNPTLTPTVLPVGESHV